MKNMKGKIGLFLCCYVLYSCTCSVFAADNGHEPIAGLEVITDKSNIKKIVTENPRIKKYLDQNEPFAELEIIVDKGEIKKIWKEKPNVKKLMKSNKDYYLALVKGKNVHLRNETSIAGEINGILDESKGDWVLLNNDYSLEQNYLWWQVIDSSIGQSGQIMNDYVYLQVKELLGHSNPAPEVDFETLKIIQ